MSYIPKRVTLDVARPYWIRQGVADTYYFYGACRWQQAEVMAAHGSVHEARGERYRLTHYGPTIKGQRRDMVTFHPTRKDAFAHVMRDPSMMLAEGRVLRYMPASPSALIAWPRIAEDVAADAAIYEAEAHAIVSCAVLRDEVEILPAGLLILDLNDPQTLKCPERPGLWEDALRAHSEYLKSHVQRDPQPYREEWLAWLTSSYILASMRHKVNEGQL